MQLLIPISRIPTLTALLATVAATACSPSSAASPAASPTPTAADGCDGEMEVIWNNAKGSEHDLLSCKDGAPSVTRWESYPDEKENRQTTALERAKWDEAWAALETADWSAKCGSDGPTTELRVTRGGTTHKLACSEVPDWFQKVIVAMRTPGSAAPAQASAGPQAEEVLALVRASTMELAVKPKATLGAHATEAFAKAKSPPAVRCEATDATHYHCTVSLAGSGFLYSMNLVNEKGWTIAPGAEVLSDD